MKKIKHPLGVARIMKTYAKLFRLKHYVKNMLILFPAFFSGKILDFGTLLPTITGTAAFCCASSFVYIINDLRDMEYDRNHPVKKGRPIASGEVPARIAAIASVFLLMASVFFLRMAGAGFFSYCCLGGYIFINLAYSLGGKNIPVLDLALLGAGYPIRVLLGGFLSGVQVSSWLFLTVLCISFYLGLGKRRGEMGRQEELSVSGNIGSQEKPQPVSRPVLEKYTIEYLDAHMYLCLGLGLVFYSLWAIERSMVLVYTVPLVMLICMKYNLLLAGMADGDPVDMLFANKSLAVLVLFYIVLIVAILYLV